MKIRNCEAALEAFFELDVLRGWREVRDQELMAAHALPALARLIQVDSENREVDRVEIHGPDAILGRFQPQHGPVDLVPARLQDHESYRLGVPHLYIRKEEKGWRIRLLTTTTVTSLRGEEIGETDHYYDVNDGDVLELGVVRFVFECCSASVASVASWQEARGALLRGVEGPALFLKRNGGICGPFLQLVEEKALVIGRTSPGKGEIPGTQGWVEVAAPDWDLAGLEERERKHIGFRHARVGLFEGAWCIEPLSQRQWTYVNRVRVRGLTRLKAGDEIGLGCVLFYFHDGQPVDDSVIQGRERIELPEILSWSEGYVSGQRGQRSKSSTERK